MADLNVSTGTIGAASPAAGAFPPNHKFYVAEFIAVANPELVYDMFGTPANIATNNSNTIVFNKVLKMDNASDYTLTEGVTPTEQQFQMVRLEKAVNQYGGFATTTDRLQSESINGLTSQFNMRIAEQGAEVMNKVVRDDLNGGTTVRYAGGVATQDDITTSTMPAADFDFMFRSFKNEKVKPIRPMTMGSPNTGTAPTRETYPVIVPWEATGLLEALDDGNGNTFQNTESYGSQRATWANEYGSFKQFSFIGNTEVATEENSASTAQEIALASVFGKGAYHTTLIGASDVEVIIKPLGSGGTTDPLNQRSTIGWKAKKGAVIVQPTYMFRYEFSLGNVA
jgi:N4-gp56 family major capsid protein